MRSQAVTVSLADESSEVHTPLIALSPEPSVDIREWACVGPRGKLEKSEPCACASSRVNLYPYQKTRVARAKIDLSMDIGPELIVLHKSSTKVKSPRPPSRAPRRLEADSSGRRSWPLPRRRKRSMGVARSGRRGRTSAKMRWYGARL